MLRIINRLLFLCVCAGMLLLSCTVANAKHPISPQKLANKKKFVSMKRSKRYKTKKNSLAIHDAKKFIGTIRGVRRGVWVVEETGEVFSSKRKAASALLDSPKLDTTQDKK